jgi:hypothetical protein
MTREEEHMKMARTYADNLMTGKKVGLKIDALTTLATLATMHYLGAIAESRWNEGLPYDAVEQVNR